MISVLRLGHRKVRDVRISTHCGLVARAFGANEIIYSGEEDKSLIERINDITMRWGGPFKVSYEKNWRGIIENAKRKGFLIVHLTMYGVPINKKISEIRKSKRLLIIIGGEKVPGEVYTLADYNISITNQPHSEVAALAVFLHEFYEGKELNKGFRNAKIRIVPQKKGKKVIEI